MTRALGLECRAMKRLAVLLGLVMGCSSGAAGVDPGGDPGGEAGGAGGSAGSSTIDVGGASGEGGAGQSGGSGQDEGGAAGSDEPGGSGSDAGKGGSINVGGTSGGSDSGPFGGSSGSTAGGGKGGSGGASTGCAAESETAEVFGHSALTLYRVDAKTKAVQTVGNMSCGFSSVIDLAINKQGEIYATTSSSLVKVDKTTAKCTLIKSGDSYPNSLSFVPAGTVFPDKEALVGYQGSTYVVIDTVTGAITTKGALTGGYTSSGDIVSVIGAGTYLTVKGKECNDNDCLVEVNPTTGDLIKKIGSANHADVFGLAYWANQLYGFTSEGQMFTYDLATNKTTDVSIPNAPFALSFYGAGSSTCARTAPIIN